MVRLRVDAGDRVDEGDGLVPGDHRSRKDLAVVHGRGDGAGGVQGLQHIIELFRLGTGKPFRNDIGDAANACPPVQYELSYLIQKKCTPTETGPVLPNGELPPHTDIIAYKERKCK